MPITLDASVGGAASNSYSDLTTANGLATMIVGPSAAAWVALTSNDEAKKRALITATRALDTLPFIGTRASATQALEWPRTGARTVTGRLYASGSLPSSLVAATVELAINYQADATSDVLDPVVNDKKRVQAGDVSVEYFGPGGDDDDLSWLPVFVGDLIRPLVRVLDAAGVWGGGIAIRAS